MSSTARSCSGCRSGSLRSTGTHGEVIGLRGRRDRAALTPLPSSPFLVDDKHLRRVGKDCLVSFEASLYSLPARQIRAGQTVELRVLPDTVAIHHLDGTLLTTHQRARVRGTWVIDERHWDGLPDGHTRATVLELPARSVGDRTDHDQPASMTEVLSHRRIASTTVAKRPLSDYAITGAGAGA